MPFMIRLQPIYFLRSKHKKTTTWKSYGLIGIMKKNTTKFSYRDLEKHRWIWLGPQFDFEANVFPHLRDFDLNE